MFTGQYVRNKEFNLIHYSKEINELHGFMISISIAYHHKQINQLIGDQNKINVGFELQIYVTTICRHNFDLKMANSKFAFYYTCRDIAMLKLLISYSIYE